MLQQIGKFFKDVGGVYIKETIYLWLPTFIFSIILAPVLFYLENWFHISSSGLLLIFVVIYGIISLLILFSIYKVQEIDYRRRRSLLLGLFTSILIIMFISAVLFLGLSYLIHNYSNISSINGVILFYLFFFIFLISLVYFSAIYGLLSLVSFIVLPSDYNTVFAIIFVIIGVATAHYYSGILSIPLDYVVIILGFLNAPLGIYATLLDHKKERLDKMRLTPGKGFIITAITSLVSAISFYAINSIGNKTYTSVFNILNVIKVVNFASIMVTLFLFVFLLTAFWANEKKKV